jgi:hypothetical protein
MFKIITLIFSVFALVGVSIYVSIRANAENQEKKYLEIEIRKNINNKLSMIAKNSFDGLDIKSDDKKIFEQYVTNEFCNTSSYTVILKSDNDLVELCNNTISSFENRKWNHIQKCRKIEREKRGRAEEFSYVIEEAISKNPDGVYYFKAGFFPSSSSYPYFFPVVFDEKSIVDYAKKTGGGFYYLNLEFQGRYDKQKYSCDYMKSDMNHREYCECLTYTYTHTFFDGKDEKKIRLSDNSFSWEIYK